MAKKKKASKKVAKKTAKRAKKVAKKAKTAKKKTAVKRPTGKTPVKKKTTKTKVAKKTSKKAAAKDLKKKRTSGAKSTKKVAKKQATKKTASAGSAKKAARKKTAKRVAKKASASRSARATKKTPTKANTAAAAKRDPKKAAVKKRVKPAVSETRSIVEATRETLPPLATQPEEERAALEPTSSLVEEVTTEAAAPPVQVSEPTDELSVAIAVEDESSEQPTDDSGEDVAAGSHEIEPEPEEPDDESKTVECVQATVARDAPDPETTGGIPEDGDRDNEVMERTPEQASVGAFRDAPNTSSVEGDSSGERDQAAVRPIAEAIAEELRSGESSTDVARDESDENATEVVHATDAAKDPEVETGGQWPSAEVISLEGRVASQYAQADKEPAPESENEVQQQPEQHGVKGSELEVATRPAGDSFMAQAINEVLRRKA